MNRKPMSYHVAVIGGLSDPDKMPCLSWSIPAHYCQVGGKLQQVEGSTCSGCYALKGCYQFPSTVAAMERRWALLQRVLSNTSDAWRFIDSFSEVLNRKMINTVKRLERGHTVKNDGRVFRWHDSGDIQSELHLSILVEIARRCPEVEFWLPTREKGYVKAFLKNEDIPGNMTIRLSETMVDQQNRMLRMWADGVPGLSVSGVHTGRLSQWADDAIGCIAYRQEGNCNDCRSCWDVRARYISYPLH